MANDPSGGKFFEYGFTGLRQGEMPTIPGAEKPQKRALAQQMYDRQLGAVKNYRDTMKSRSDEQFNAAAAGERQQLAAAVRNQRNRFNARGLLNSGMERGAEAGEAANSRVRLANTRSQINRQNLDTLQGMENDAFGIAANNARPGAQTADFDLAQLGTNIAAQQKNAALAAQMYGQASQGIGSAIGYGAGALSSGGSNGGAPASGQSRYWQDPYGNSPYSGYQNKGGMGGASSTAGYY